MVKGLQNNISRRKRFDTAKDYRRSTPGTKQGDLTGEFPHHVAKIKAKEKDVLLHSKGDGNRKEHPKSYQEYLSLRRSSVGLISTADR
jgi:hypothetical protein